ncbi:hypothetical protein FRZ67_05725 [Panacibacter ginsenosidivorans]|uniref:S1/P1 Nuclease n=1 Tax=Panacibacter ginsenosidivorans TaxID=1813871 RepID=A0A5B8V7Z0_9BACT|nr:zinc dependent phospholipase C family protein [Panacibacter ginsenosidivorans]QEC66826.1 hypothetical protein FRZ67_05725 [Panacibacter ginsenosidivorans]
MWKNRFKKILFSVLLVSITLVISSWGFLAHKTIHQLAIYELPKDLCNFFYHNIDYLQYNSVRPDIRRNNDKSEEPKHYIDFEAYGDSAAYTMPWQWNDACKKFSKDTLLKYGYAPYWIIEMQKKLTNAFKQGNADSILFYAADLGHYIEDINVPLHTSINYDGQLTNQKGLHALWETVVPEIEITNYNLSSGHKAKYIKNKERAVWSAAQRSHALLPAVFAKETEVSRRFTDATKYRIEHRNGKDVKYYTTDFAKAYGAALGSSINQQLMNAANMVADFWYTAWTDAGKPELDKLPKAKLSDKEKQQLKKELRSFKHNTLIKDGYLRSKGKK